MHSFRITFAIFLQSLFILKSNGQDFRLPETVKPSHYELKLQPILDETPGFTRFTAPGQVTIKVDCLEDTSTIKLHALDITINEEKTTVRDVQRGELLTIESLTTEPFHHFFIINLGESLRAGSEYEIFIDFVAQVSQTRLVGMYLDEYVDPATNVTKYVATTTFAAISARQCFPSFDEPQLKAVFTISLVRKEGYHSLSNRHLISTQPLPGMDEWFVDEFAPTLKMSTYLVAMIVSDMTYEEDVKVEEKAEADNTTIRVYAPYYFIDRGGGKYAVNQTKTVLAQFENYFDSLFTMDKLDSVSLPRFQYSAMENWGLITYNDRVLLYFPGETTEPERYRITSIIAHEVVHHYFGNTVTCEWWSWVWLNEGSATYWSYLGVELTYPEFLPWERFITDTYQVAMDNDSGPNTHPVENEPKSTEDIGGIYDAIAYQKGASLIWMMRSFLTAEVVQDANRKYLKDNAFGNVQQDELFRQLQISANDANVILPVSLKTIMDTWTKQAGFPLIRVERIDNLRLRFTQERFNSTGTDEKWWVPITIQVITPEPKEFFFWMDPADDETIFEVPEGIFVVNPRSEGFYRTLYSPLILSALLKNDNKVGSAGKAKLLDDYMTFYEYGMVKLNPSRLFDNFLSKQENLLVWQTIFKHYIRRLLQAQDISQAQDIRSGMKKDLLPHIQLQLNLEEDENGEKAILQAELLFWTCFLDGNQSICKDYVMEKMNNWIRSEKEASPFSVEYEETLFCSAAAMNESFASKIFAFMQSRKSQGGKIRVLSSLACSTSPDILEKVMPQLEKVKISSMNELESENLPYLRAKLRLMFNGSTKTIL